MSYFEGTRLIGRSRSDAPGSVEYDESDFESRRSPGRPRPRRRPGERRDLGIVSPRTIREAVECQICWCRDAHVVRSASRGCWPMLGAPLRDRPLLGKEQLRLFSRKVKALADLPVGQVHPIDDLRVFFEQADFHARLRSNSDAFALVSPDVVTRSPSLTRRHNGGSRAQLRGPRRRASRALLYRPGRAAARPSACR